MNISAIIIATNQSNIYFGVSEQIIMGIPVLEHIIKRIKRIPIISKICLATTTNKCDDRLTEIAKNNQVAIFRGVYDDIICLLNDTAQYLNANYIIKIKGNYPLIDPELTSFLIQTHLSDNYEYSYNESNNGVIYGTGCEIINSDILSQINSNTSKNSFDRQCNELFYYISSLGIYRTNNLSYDNPRPFYKVCIENYSDLKLVKDIFNNIKAPRVENVIEYLDNHSFIAESNIQSPIKEVGLEKLFLFPDKIGQIVSATKDCPDISYPISVELSLTNRCNLNCIWCSDKELRKRLKDDLNYETFKELIDDLAKGGVKGIVIEGGGEPLLYQKFNESIEYIRSKNLACGLITNGTRIIDKKVLSLLDWIRVSLDASNDEEYLQLKGSDKFEKVLFHVSHASKYCHTVGIGYVVTNQNTSSLDPLILRLRDIGVRYVQFRSVIDHPELSTNINLAYLKRYNFQPQFSILSDGMKENCINGNHSKPCKAHSLTSIITADGGVYLCGRLNKYEWVEPIGNIRLNSFQQIWQGAKRKEQANLVLSSEFCHHYCPECRITKFNILFDKINNIKTKNFI